jgi:hypothetical protein
LPVRASLVPSASMPVRAVSLRVRAQYPLSDAQLAAFGGKRHLQRRLADLGLANTGARQELRDRLAAHLGLRTTSAPKEQSK